MYLNIVELAESFGVEERVIQDWVRHEGLPHVPDRGRLRFDRAQVIAWAARSGHAAKAGFLAAQQPGVQAGVRLEPLLRAGGIWRDVPAAGVLDRLEQVVGRIAGATPPVRQVLLQRVRGAEGISWAPIGEGLALPHLRVPVALGRDGGVLALLFLREPLEQPSLDAVPITRLLFFIAPSPRAHLEWLGQLSTALLRGRLKPLLLTGAPDAELLAAIDPAPDLRGPQPSPS
jgi:PTS system nitrogen regulatory IIA component